MDAPDLLALYDLEERIRAQPAGMQREETAYVIRHVPLEPRSGFRDGFISYSRLAERDVAPAIDQQVRFFDALRLSFEWKVYEHDTPPDLRQRLAAYGFEVEEGEAIMALVLDEAPAQLLAPVAHDVRLLDDPDQLDDYMAVQRVVWQKNLAGQAGELRDSMIMYPKLTSVYVAYDRDEPVASARLYHDGRSPFASLWGGSTLPSQLANGASTRRCWPCASRRRSAGARSI